MINEQEYVLSTFLTNYSNISNEPIAIYGVGNNTRILLESEEVKKINIVGLMDAECIGQVIYGKKVLSNEQAVKMCKIIVVVARPSVLKIIYDRISFLDKKYGIKICNIEGQELKDLFEEKASDIENLKCWNITQDKLLKMIDEHEIISFDIFDTLVMRKILRPEDIFKVVELKLKGCLNLDIEFKEIRMKSERKLNCVTEAPNINEIYDEMQIQLGISNEVKDKIKDIEYETECEYIIPRRKMVDIYNYAVSKGKQVYIISDMYYCKENIINILEQCGIKIVNKDNIIISCEYNKTKASGKLFEYYKSINNNTSMLHIGDNIKSDVEIPRKYGIDSFYILNAYDMLINSTYSSALVDIKTIEEKIILGLIIGRIFNDPFVLNKGKGKYIANNLKDIGYVFFGPLIFNFMIWLINKLKASKYEIILFAARDGYLINYLYKKLVENLDITCIPTPIYFKTSRRAITVPNIKTKDDISFILNKSYKCTKQQLLKERFGIDICEDNDEILINNDENNKLILKYSDKIIENASRERKSYLKYINSLNICDKSNIAIFDLCSSGTIQFYLSKLIGKKVHGFYLSTMNLPNLFYKDNSEIDSQLGNADQYYSLYNATKYYMLLESVMTDPNSTMVRCKEDGGFVYNTEETKERDFSKIDKIHKGIKEFVDDYISLKGLNILNEFRIKFADDIFGLFVSNKTIVTDEVKNIFYTESSYDFNSEFNIWKTI